jgi:hypothetical protein
MSIIDYRQAVIDKLKTASDYATALAFRLAPY